MKEAARPDSLRGDPNRKVRFIARRRILFDGEGFFMNPEDWSEEVAESLARECGLKEMTEMHWRVIRFQREYFFNHGRAPLTRDLRDGMGTSLMALEDLFPGEIRRGARRLAGLPNPKTCM